MSASMGNKHFMTLNFNFTVPRHKASVIQHMTGNDYFRLSKRIRDHRSSSSDSVINNSEYCHGSSCSQKDTTKVSRALSEIMVEVHNIGLIPSSEWPIQLFSLRDLRDNYFRKENGACRQFDIKLYNALLITKHYPKAAEYIGVSWVDNDTFKVNERAFVSFFGLKNIFRNQGWFSRYSFEQVYKISEYSYSRNSKIADVDNENVCLFKDRLHRFSRDKKFSCVFN